jgi:hypothetical protein
MRNFSASRRRRTGASISDSARRPLHYGLERALIELRGGHNEVVAGVRRHDRGIGVSGSTKGTCHSLVNTDRLAAASICDETAKWRFESAPTIRVSCP